MTISARKYKNDELDRNIRESSEESPPRKKAPLFREPAVRAQDTRLDGNVLIVDYITYRSLAFFYLVLVIAIALFLYFGTYARKVPVLGILEPVVGLSKIYSGVEGELLELYVSEGDIVNKGDPLAKIVTDSISGGDYANKAVVSELENLLLVLQENMGQVKKQYALEEQGLQMEKQSTIRLITSLNYQKKQIANKELIVKEKIKALEILKNKGIISVIEFNNEKMTSYDMELRLGQVNVSINDAKFKFNKIKSDIKKLPVNHKITLNDITQKMSTIRQQLSQARLRHSNTLLAPVDGHITTMINKVGDRVVPGFPLMSVLPEWSLMQAKIYVPASGISFVHEGQQISIQYQALPVQRYGTFPGTIVSISETPISPKDIKDSPFNFEQSVYILKAKIKDQNIDIEGKTFPIVPGMGVKISLLAEEQSLLEWLLEPVWDVKERF